MKFLTVTKFEGLFKMSSLSTVSILVKIQLEADSNPCMLIKLNYL